MTLDKLSGGVLIVKLVDGGGDLPQQGDSKGYCCQVLVQLDKRIIPVVFNKTIDTTDDVHENLTFGILFGKFVILNPPLKVYYRNIPDLFSIFDCISPPKSSLTMIVFRSTKKTVVVTYFCPKTVIQKLQRLDAPTFLVATLLSTKAQSGGTQDLEKKGIMFVSFGVSIPPYALKVGLTCQDIFILFLILLTRVLCN